MSTANSVMLPIRSRNLIIEAILSDVSLQPSLYELATERYTRLGVWFCRPESSIREFELEVASQGSFRLGTAIRPMNEDDGYDLDLSARLTQGVSMATHTQLEVRRLVKGELEAFRTRYGIKNRVREKHRCLCLDYQDEVSFHLDIVPCIPSSETQRQRMTDGLRSTGLAEGLVDRITSHTVFITDNQHPRYDAICDDWQISNPEGYAQWFEDRVQFGDIKEERAGVEPVPRNNGRAVLQRAIQLLKRHRDCMFINNSDSKPISIIITTLAAHAYRGSRDVAVALDGIVAHLVEFAASEACVVPNPVDPCEDFADKWKDSSKAHLRLKENFASWAIQAKRDLELLATPQRRADLELMTEQRFRTTVDASLLAATVSGQPVHRHRVEIRNPPKPWSNR